MVVVDPTSAFETSSSILPDHVSFSQLDLMIRCPEAWRRRYLMGQRGTSSPALAIGSSVHAGIAAMYEQLRTNPKASKQKLRDTAVQTAANTLADIETRDSLTLDVEADETTALLEVYAAQRPTHVKPVAIEKPITVSLPDSDISLIGYVDCEAEDSLIEIKTSSRKITVPTGAWKVQAWLYQAAIPKPVEWHVLVKTKTPILITSAALAVPYQGQVSRKAVMLASATLERIHKLYEQRGPYEEWPTEGILHPWACSTCDARSECSMGRKA